MAIWWLVALGGAFGAVTRFAIQAGMMSILPSFPVGTAIANFVGCFLAGLASSCIHAGSAHIRALLLTGFMGAFTTFSSFALEIVLQIETSKRIFALAHWLGGAFLCILLCYIGLRVGAWLTGSP